MSLTSYEPRTLPSVFSDIPAHREVQAAKEEVQKARARAGRMWIWILLVLGVLIAVGIGAVWAYQQYQSEVRTSDNLRAQITDLQSQQQDFETFAERRQRLEQVRSDLAANIEFVRRQNGQAAERVTTAAQRAWREAAPTYPPLDLTNGSQLWGQIRDNGVATLDTEARAMEAVRTAVDNAIARESGVSGPRRPPCNPVTGANCGSRRP